METVNNVVEIITIELSKDNKKRSDIILDSENMKKKFKFTL